MQRSCIFRVVALCVAMDARFAVAQHPEGDPANTNTTSWPAEASGLQLHMIGNAHIDAPWLWPLSEANAVVHSTFRSALDRMKEDPELTMTTSSSQFYEWMEASDPGMLAEIKAKVDAGKWDLVGGWWVEPDVNIPSGESLIRQGLYGQRTLQRIFGRRADVGYNPDSFGHTGSLPHILKLQGLRYYVFMRPNALEKPEIKQNLFEWQGIDGTRTLTYRIPLFYDDPGDVRSHMERTVAALSGQPERTDMEFFGIGDHGGGPTKENIRSIRKIQTEQGAPRIFYSTPDRYFAEVAPHLPVAMQSYAGDLQHHSVGTYTGDSMIKKLNRTTEAALQTAEKFSAMGSVAWGAPYPKAEFTKAWERVLLLQFHDSMAGTTLPDHALAEMDGFGHARDVATEALDTSLQRLAWQIPTTDPESKYLVVFNPHAWTARLNIEYDLGWEENTPTRVEDATGKPVPFQWIAASAVVNHRQRLVAQVEVPPMGYQQIRVRRPAPGSAASESSALRASANGIENEHVRVTFAAGGTIGIYDKDAAREVFQGGATGLRPVLYDDNNDTWAHEAHIYDKEVGAFTRTEIKVVEQGPLRARIRQKFSYGASKLTIDYLLYAGSGKLQTRVTLDWHEHLKLLKFSFPVNVAAPEVTYEVAYGALRRDNKGYEDPGQRWVDVSESKPGSYGVAVVNDAKYGYSVHGSDLRVSIARAAVYANHEPRALHPDVDYQWMDQGAQTLQLEIIPHRGTWQSANVVRAAEELVTETPIVYQGIHPGTRKGADSFLAVDKADVVVEAVKQSEDGDDLIVRSYETGGQPSEATISFPALGRQWTGTYHPFEIKTLRLVRSTGVVREVNALEE